MDFPKLYVCMMPRKTVNNGLTTLITLAFSSVLMDVNLQNLSHVRVLGRRGTEMERYALQ